MGTLERIEQVTVCGRTVTAYVFRLPDGSTLRKLDVKLTKQPPQKARPANSADDV